jgi:DNA-binding beta-propeller fold protein YncE
MALMSLVNVLPITHQARSSQTSTASLKALGHSVTQRDHSLPAGTLVVLNSGEDSVLFINPRDLKSVKKLVLHKHPQDVVVSPDERLAYVAEMGSMNEPGNTIAVIDSHEHRILRRFELGRVTQPHLLVLSRNGRTLWAACAPQKAIVELNTRDGSIRRVWDTTQAGSYLLAVTPNERKLYVANFDAGTVSVIRRSDASVRVLSLGGQPIGIDVSPNGREVWVSNLNDNTIAVINAATDRIDKIFPSGGIGPARLRFTADGKKVVVSHASSNELVVFNAARRRMIRRIATGKFSKGLLILPNGKHAFVSAMDESQVVEVDVSEGRVVQRIPVGKLPEGLAWIFSKRVRVPSPAPIRSIIRKNP